MDTQTPTTSPATPSVLLAWSAPSHCNHERSARWYAIGGGLIAIVTLYGFWSGAWSLSLVSLLIGGMYYLVRREHMPMHTIEIQSDGVLFEGNFTPWKQCKDFWIIATPLYTELHIARKTKLKGDIRIQTANIDTTQIRSTVSQYLPIRENQTESFLDAVTRLCKL